MMKIFENWTFTRVLPEPFAGVAANRGKKDTTEASCLSVHNHMSRMKRATLRFHFKSTAGRICNYKRRPGRRIWCTDSVENG